jgi:hypothetical protein
MGPVADALVDLLPLAVVLLIAGRTLGWNRQRDERNGQRRDFKRTFRRAGTLVACYLGGAVLIILIGPTVTSDEQKVSLAAGGYQLLFLVVLALWNFRRWARRRDDVA